MPSAACYTNKRRVLAESSVTKVQYPGKIAVNNDVILSARNCSPDFGVLVYKVLPNCNKVCGIAISYPFTYSGGNAFSNPTGWISGGNAGNNAISYSGGNASSNPTGWISGGNAGAPLSYGGGNAFTSPSSGISGGSANT